MCAFVNKGMQCVDKTKDIIADDYVRVELDVEVFQMMQTDNHGGWHDGMAAVRLSANNYNNFTRSQLP